MPRAIVYGESGALKDLLEKIAHPSIARLEDIPHFRKEYPQLRRKKVEEGEFQVKTRLLYLASELDMKRLQRTSAHQVKSTELTQVLAVLESEQGEPVQVGSLWVNVFNKIRTWHRNRKIKRIKSGYESALRKATKKFDKQIATIEDKVERIQANLQAEAEKEVRHDLRELDRLEEKLEKEKFLYYGAVGEQDVIQKLRGLPESFHVINDFKKSFSRPIYNRAEQDRIYSIQIDHLVVGPTGIFVIETKNWSEETISSEVHFSPIKQVRRAGFALFVIMNQALRPRGILGIFSRGRGKKLSFRQVVVFRNNVPQGSHQFVRCLGIGNLNSYITYGSKLYEPEEVREIVEYLLRSNAN